MISTSGKDLVLTPTAPSDKHPCRTLPLLSLHTCLCGAVLKAFARADARIPRFTAYDPEESFRIGQVPGGLVLVRSQPHGDQGQPCFGYQPAWGGATEAARMIAEVLVRAGVLAEAAKINDEVVAPTALDRVGVHVVRDVLELRPPVYLVNPQAAFDGICGRPDYVDHEAWQPRAAEAAGEFVASLSFRARLPPVPEVRRIDRPPRRRTRCVPVVGPVAAIPPVLPTGIGARPRRSRAQAAQLSLFPT